MFNISGIIAAQSISATVLIDSGKRQTITFYADSGKLVTFFKKSKTEINSIGSLMTTYTGKHIWKATTIDIYQMHRDGDVYYLFMDEKMNGPYQAGVKVYAPLMLKGAP